MSTLQHDRQQQMIFTQRRIRAWKLSVRHYLVASVLCAVFSLIYESFSHGVLSLWMMGLGLIPLVLGALPTSLCGLCKVKIHPLARELWACAVTTLTIGSCLMGVLEIYGTTSPLVVWYLPVGLVLIAGAVVCQVRQR